MQAFYAGDVRNVLFGKLPEKVGPIDTTKYRCGFESGSVMTGSIKGAGEMILLNGRAYVRCTDDTNHDCYLKSLNDTSLYTTGAIFVPHDAKPARVLEDITPLPGSGDRLLDVLTMAWKEVQPSASSQDGSVPVVLSGVIGFSRMRATYITKAPCCGDNLFAPEHKKSYFAAGEIVRENVYGEIVAVVHNFKLGVSPNNAKLQEELNRVLYFNPNDPSATSTALSTHTHVALLSQPPSDTATSFAALDDSEVVPEMLDNDDAVFHLYSDSVVSRVFRLNIFPLASLSPLL